MEGLLRSVAGEDEWSRHQALERLREKGATADRLDALAEALSDGGDATRRSAARMALAALASPDSPARDAALALLRRGLRSDDPDLRILAASALGESRNPGGAPALIAALDDPEPNVAAAAADALGDLGDASAIGPLADRTGRGSFWIRAGSIVALGRIGDPRALPALGRAAGEPGLEQPVAEAVGRIGSPDGLPVLATLHERAPLDSLLTAGSLLCAHPGTPPPDWVVEGARSRLATLRNRLAADDDPAVARLIGLTGDPAAIAQLIELIGPPRRSEAAVGGLVAAPPDRRTDAILDRLEQADSEERVTLLALLPPLDAESNVRRLVPLLGAPDPTVRAAAADSLARAPAEQALPLLTIELSRSAVAPEVVRALGGLGGVACGALLPLLEDPKPTVRRAAADALTRCGSAETATAILAALDAESDDQVRASLLRAYGSAAGADAVDRLARSLDHPDPQLRLAAIEALTATGAREAVAALAPALDRDAPESLAALRALGDLGHPEAASLLQPGLRSSDVDTRRVAARSAIAFAAAFDADEVRRLSRDDDEWVRIFAARILARRPDTDLGTLRTMAEEDPATAVRSEARQGLGARR